MNWITSIETPSGVFTAEFSTRGLTRLEFPSLRPPKPTPEPLPANFRRWHKLASTALLAALAGRASKKLPPLDWTGATDFQRSVWAALRSIPPGTPSTYAQIASALKRPRAARAVGAACGANPIPVFVPCHRVIAADGGLGGFSAGLEWKLRLLALEGAFPGTSSKRAR